MPKIILIASGREIPVTDEGLAKIKANPETEKLYKYPKADPPAEEPEEIARLKKDKSKKPKPEETPEQ